MLLGIALPDQLEGHVLQPLVMVGGQHPPVGGGTVGSSSGTILAGLFGAGLRCRWCSVLLRRCEVLAPDKTEPTIRLHRLIRKVTLGLLYPRSSVSPVEVSAVTSCRSPLVVNAPPAVSAGSRRNW